MNLVIQLQDVHKTYHTGEFEVKAVRGVSLQIAAGEFSHARCSNARLVMWQPEDA